MCFSRYKIFIYFEAVVHESLILSSPTSTCIVHSGAIRLHDHLIVYDTLSDLPLYAIHHTILVISISCKGQHVLSYYNPSYPQANRLSDVGSKNQDMLKLQQTSEDRPDWAWVTFVTSCSVHVWPTRPDFF